MKRMVVVLGVVGFVCAATVAAQAQEDLKKVAGWNGEWATETQGRDTEAGEEWTFQGKAKQHQVGEHFYVWNGKWTAPDGKDMKYLGVTGWDPAKKAYFGVGFRSDGYKETSVVTFGDGTVVYDVTGTSATGEAVRVRCTWTVPKDKYEGKCETLTDGKWWHSSMEKGVRVK